MHINNLPDFMIAGLVNASSLLIMLTSTSVQKRYCILQLFVFEFYCCWINVFDLV